MSGDRIVLPFLKYLIERGVNCRGLGGESLVHEGLDLVCQRDGLSVTGVTEALGGVVPTIRAYRILSSLVKSVDALLLCDYPEVNLRLAKQAHRWNIPVVYLAPPQAWAWRPWRAKVLARSAYVGCLFPFSTDWYCSRGVAARWLGHPLAEIRASFDSRLKHIALLPGSRSATIRRVLPTMMKIVRLIRESQAEVRFTIVRCKEVPEVLFASYLEDCQDAVSITTDVDSTLSQSTVSIVHPGTATLHAALRGSIPVAVCDPTKSTRLFGRLLMNVDHLSLPNLLLDSSEFPEFIMETDLEYAVAEAAIRALNSPEVYRSALTNVWSACFNEVAHREPEIAFRFLFS